MAEKDPFQKLKEQLQCAICLDTYINPRVLQCAHVYCEQCLGKLVAGSRSGARQEELTLTCPNCRKVTPIPEGGVKDLQPAFQINNLLEIQASLDKNGDRSPSGSKATSFCPEHSGEVSKLYCETCNHLICFKCVLESGRHHKCDYEMLNKRSAKYRAELFTSLEPIKSNIASIKAAQQQFTARYGEICNQQVAVETSIKTSIKQLHDALEFRQTKLLDQLKQDAGKKLESLGAKMNEIEELLTRLEMYQAGVEEKLTASNDEELVAMGSTLIMQIEHANSLCKSDVLRPGKEPHFEFIGSTDAIEVCKHFGVFSSSTSESLPDPAKCYGSGSGMEAALVGEEVAIQIHGVNESGDPCEVPIKLLTAELVSEINADIRIASDVVSNGKQLLLKHTPTAKGWHKLHIKINGQHIEGSPFPVLVTSQQYVPISAFKVEKPWGVVVNHQNEIIVSEHEKHCISVFNSNGNKLRSFGALGCEEGNFNHPCGLTVDPQDNVFVTDYKNHRIQKFTLGGEFVAAVGAKGSGTLQFKGPKDIAYNSFNKRLYIVDENNRVQVLNLDLDFCNVFGGHGYGIGELSKPWGIECDRSGKVYVPLQGQGRIQVFGADGTFLHAFGKFGSVSFPFGIAIDSKNRLLLGDHHKDCISIFNLDGEALNTFCKRGREAGQLNHPRGIAVGDCDVLYVCDYNNDRISIF